MSSRIHFPLACALFLGLGGCTFHRQAPDAGPPPPTQSIPRESAPPSVPAPEASVPATPGRSKTHSRYAPPPGGQSYWDNALGVYVLEGTPDLYYRERVYYRWQDGWSESESPQGPWQPTDINGVPAGLGRHYAQ
ncbi:hypothetical protein [Pseudomonas sp. RIT-PI-AD]|uniref:hypothetical protein n=1 Tax=Pseudomonas sp. RIT-PI-AD TaxID=3035294 RepID=UPI0021D91027|nr:hypothetical protein [Pseudomonas sp. RIT-PI-AD]